jgi:UDPglucose 6-dehydrogenase
MPSSEAAAIIVGASAIGGGMVVAASNYARVTGLSNRSANSYSDVYDPRHAWRGGVLDRRVPSPLACDFAMSSSSSPVVVVGAGYVGLVTAVGLAQTRRVKLVDHKATVLELLGRGEMPISEPDLERRFAQVRERIELFPRLEDVLNDGGVELVFVAVGTPLVREPATGPARATMRLELRGVKHVLDTLMEYRGLAVVMKSTVPPGTGDAALERIRERDSDLVYLSCPEFLQEGNAFDGIDRPDRVIVGRVEPSWATMALGESIASCIQTSRTNPILR